MFTDGPVTPMHLETLLDLLRDAGARKVDAQAAAQLVQPQGLPKLNPDRGQTKQALAAAEELALTRREDGVLLLTAEKRDKRTTREMVLDAIDARVLASREVEPYFALFYSYLLGQGKKGTDPKKTRDQWANEFNHQVFGAQKQSDPFNPTKLTGLHRWLRYAGLGWYDPAGVFQCNPYDRLRRALPSIFDGKKKLQGNAFMEGLGKVCPELDGGEIFRLANRNYDDAARVCTLGLSHALVDLHLDAIVILHCPQDSRGWSLQEADPLPLDNQTFRSARIDFVELPKGR